MAKASRTEIFEAAIENIYKVIVDYESYPEFMTGVSSVSVDNFSDKGAKVTYSINMIKKLTYTLDLVHDEPRKVSWSFDSGDLFKVNNGSWELKDLGDGTTEVTYNIELDIKGFFPGAGTVTKKLTETQLPSMMKSVCERANNL
ncbi:MAG: hypothetical protein BM556_15095 [Bacteriovorax sp. MedPE-SWde]|nr:MAG: hypothetical protein BM556_15095 [Bacteriovorax sp. MedPE-SWde]